MDFVFISDVLMFITMALVVIGLLFFAAITFKYEALAHENPDRTSEYRNKRKSLLKIYLRTTIFVFIMAIVTRFLL
jgi:heme/copper-type cytochrome/quinol oxidase subunit 2